MMLYLECGISVAWMDEPSIKYFPRYYPESLSVECGAMFHGEHERAGVVDGNMSSFDLAAGNADVFRFCAECQLLVGVVLEMSEKMEPNLGRVDRWLEVEPRAGDKVVLPVR